MFDRELPAEVKRVEVLVPKVDGPVAKACRVTFRRDLDPEIARALGGKFGEQALKQLHDRGIVKVEFPIDSITAKAVLEGDGGRRLVISQATGMKATGKVKKLGEKKEPDHPQVELKFQFAWSAEAWAFLGENACTTITLRLTRAQLQLPGTGRTAEAEEAEAAAKPTGKLTKKLRGGKAARSSRAGVHHPGLEGSA